MGKGGRGAGAWGLAMLVGVSVAVGAVEPTNRCPNPRFREGAGTQPAGWTFAGKHTGAGVWMDKRGRNRGRCLELKLSGGGRARWTSDPIGWDAPAGDVSGWLRPNRIVPDDAKANAAVDLWCYDGKGKRVARLEIGSVNGTHEWQYVHRVVAVPAGVKRVCVAFHFNLLHRGQARLSDVVLRRATAEQAERFRRDHPTEQRVTLSTGLPGNVFAPGQALRFVVKAPAGVGTLPYRLFDDRGRLQRRGRVDTPDGAGNLTLQPRADWAGRLLRLVVGEGQTGASLPTAILPERATATGGDPRFGAWVVAKPVDVLKLGVRIGITTAYPNWNLDAPSVAVYRQHGMNLTTNGFTAERLFHVWPFEDLYKHGYRQDTRLAEWRAGFTRYLKAHRSTITAMSSLGGEYVLRDARTAPALRDLHAHFYSLVRQIDPHCRVYLGMLLSGPFYLERILACADRETFRYDGVSYDVSYDWAGCAEWRAESILEYNLSVMRRFGQVRPQWICECHSPFRDEQAKAGYLARIHALGFGLGCREIDWHSYWYAVPQRLWLWLPARNQSLFRGQNFELTPAAIAYYQSYRHLGHAEPTGRLIDDTHVAGFGFRQGTRHVATLWTRNRPGTVALRTAADVVEVCDQTGGVYQLQPVGGRVVLGLTRRLTYVQARAPIAVEQTAGLLTPPAASIRIAADGQVQKLALSLSPTAPQAGQWTLSVPGAWTVAAATPSAGRTATFSVTAPADTPTGAYPAVLLLSKAGRRFAAQPLTIEVASRFVWGDRGIARRPAIEAVRAEVRGEKPGWQVATELRNNADTPIVAQVRVTDTLTDRLRPERRSLGQVSLEPGQRRWVSWPASYEPEDVPYPLTFHFQPADGDAFESRTYVFGLAPVKVEVPNASMEQVSPKSAKLPDGFWVSRGPWEYRRDRADAHSGRAYLRILPPDRTTQPQRHPFTRMSRGVRVNPGRRCYGRVWLRAVPKPGRPVNLAYGLALCLYSRLGRHSGPTTSIWLPPLREANTWTPLDFTFTPSPTECHVWLYLDVQPGGPAIDVDDLVISEQPLPPVPTGKARPNVD